MLLNIHSAPAHQDDPRSPQTQLCGGLQTQARGAPGDDDSLTNQAGQYINDNDSSPLIFRACNVQVNLYLPWLAVAQRAFHKMFQCKVHESSNHTKYYRQTNNPDPNSWNVDTLECFDISISLLLPGIILSMISSLAILEILFTTWNFKTWNWSLCLTLSDILVKNYHIIWANFLS